MAIRDGVDVELAIVVEPAWKGLWIGPSNAGGTKGLLEGRMRRASSCCLSFRNVCHIDERQGKLDRVCSKNRRSEVHGVAECVAQGNGCGEFV